MLFCDKVPAKMERMLLRHGTSLPLRDRNTTFCINRDLSGRAVLMWDHLNLEIKSDEKPGP